MLLFATMPKEIARITKKYMENPKEIVIGRKMKEHLMLSIYIIWLLLVINMALKRIADYYPNIYAILFVELDAKRKRLQITYSRWIRCRCIAWRIIAESTRFSNGSFVTKPTVFSCNRCCH